MTLARAIARAAASQRRNPPAWEPTLPVQRLFHAATVDHRFVAVFGANGVGKTRALARVFVEVFEGRHPRWRHPIQILLCVTGWQSVSARDFADQLYSIAPEGLLGQQDIKPDGRTTGPVRDWYSPQRGFIGEPPRIVVLRGPMRATILDVTTLGAGSSHSAGGTRHLVAINEPIDQRTWGELVGRGRGVGGAIWYLFTATEGSPDQLWVKERSERGLLHLVQVELTPEALTLSTGRLLEPWEDVEHRIALWPDSERDMRCGRSWKPLRGNTYFADVWRSDLVQPCQRGHQVLILGVDHSTRIGRTRLVVSAFTADDRILRCHSLIDIRSTTADLEAVAAELLDGLAALGLTLENLDHLIGDRVAVDRQLVRRDNQALRAAILAVLRRRGIRSVPRCLDVIRQPKKRRGSHIFRLSYLRVMLAERRWLIDPACLLLPGDIQRFDGRDQAPEKDGLDAVGYSVELAGLLTGTWLPPPDLHDDHLPQQPG